MVTEYKAPEKEIYVTGKKYIKIFLAGSIEMGKADDWQNSVVEALKHRIKDANFEICIFNPRRDNWDSSWQQSIENQQFKEQVQWELSHIDRSNIVAFYFQPGTISPISLYELGVVSIPSSESKKNIIILCPEGYHRKGNVDVSAQWYDMQLTNSFEDFVSKIEEAIIREIQHIKTFGYYYYKDQY